MGTRHLAGRMDEVTRYERPLPLRRNPHTDMPRCMAGGRFEPHFIAQLVIGLDPIHKTSGEHWVHAITQINPRTAAFPDAKTSIRIRHRQ
jgi:hypothetical protein